MPCPRSLRAKPILAPAPLLLGGGDLAALFRAVLRGGLGRALALAPFLALAGVVRALARAGALALVDAFTLHRAASFLLRLVLRERGAGNEERGDSGSEDGILDRHVCASRESEPTDNRRGHPLHATPVSSSYEPAARTVTFKNERDLSPVSARPATAPGTASLPSRTPARRRDVG